MSRELIKGTATGLVGPVDVAVTAVSRHDRYELLMRVRRSWATLISPEQSHAGGYGSWEVLCTRRVRLPHSYPSQARLEECAFLDPLPPHECWN